jgi:hypothetical protein
MLLIFCKAIAKLSISQNWKKKTPHEAWYKLQQLHPPKCRKIEIMVIEKRKYTKKKLVFKGLKTT